MGIFSEAWRFLARRPISRWHANNNLKNNHTMRYDIADTNLLERMALFSQVHRTNPAGGSKTFVVVSENLVPRCPSRSMSRRVLLVTIHRHHESRQSRWATKYSFSHSHTATEVSQSRSASVIGNPTFPILGAKLR